MTLRSKHYRQEHRTSVSYTFDNFTFFFSLIFFFNFFTVTRALGDALTHLRCILFPFFHVLHRSVRDIPTIEVTRYQRRNIFRWLMDKLELQRSLPDIVVRHRAFFVVDFADFLDLFFVLFSTSLQLSHSATGPSSRSRGERLSECTRFLGPTLPSTIS